MPSMHIAFVLELYQPPTQDFKTLNRINNECYVPLAELLVTDPRPRITLSVTSSLIKLLDDFGLSKPALTHWHEGIRHGNIELAHSGAYHSVFPLLSDNEVRRQLVLDVEAKKKAFQLSETRGVLPPELCYRDSLIPVFRDLGFSWTLVDDKLMVPLEIPVPTQNIYTCNGIALLLRSSLWSDRIRRPREYHQRWTGRGFLQEMQRELEDEGQDCYKVIMLPGETFGHHIRYFQEIFLRDMFYALEDFPDIRLCTVSDLLANPAIARVERESQEQDDFIYFPPSSISTWPEDWGRQDPYPHFHSRGNPIHERLWRLTDLILEVTERLDFEQPTFERLRQLLDTAFYSGQYYHASLWFWDKSHIFEGIDRQMRALYEYHHITGDEGPLREGQELYTELMGEIRLRDERERKSVKD